VPIAREVFDRHIDGPNQLPVAREDVTVRAADLIAQPGGPRTEEGLRHNIRVGVQYIEAWLRGNGCVPLYHLMEDAATAEISRAQVWQWIRHGAALDDGRTITAELFRGIMETELARLRGTLGEEHFACGRFDDAANLFDALSTAPPCADFLTLRAYERLDEEAQASALSGTSIGGRHDHEG
jgi:malate synthase